MKKVAAPLDPTKMTAILRAGVLAMGPEDIGLTGGSCPRVWGVMMELGEVDVVVSLVVLVDGSVSVYLSDGSGVIGCGLHPDVRAVAAKMLNVADQAVAQCEPTDHYPQPDEYQVRFYLLTESGVLGATAARADLDEGAVALAELYYAGHGVIGMVELLGAGVELVDEMRFTANAVRREADAAIVVGVGDSGHGGTQELPARGRGCRILPYVGNVARRSQN